MLLGLQGLIESGLVKWISSQTYQAVSGAGKAAIEEYLEQAEMFLKDKDRDILNLSTLFPVNREYLLGGPIFGNLLPWIDSDLGEGQSKEEWKAHVEASKILGRELLVDGTCVRVGSFRVHAQALTVCLKEEVELREIEQRLKEGNNWVQFVENTRNESLAKLTPLHFQNTLGIGVGRVRNLHGSKKRLNIFTLGDQLLWGAAEPLRRALYLID